MQHVPVFGSQHFQFKLFEQLAHAASCRSTLRHLMACCQRCMRIEVCLSPKKRETMGQGQALAMGLLFQTSAKSLSPPKTNSDFRVNQRAGAPFTVMVIPVARPFQRRRGDLDEKTPYPEPGCVNGHLSHNQNLVQKW